MGWGKPCGSPIVSCWGVEIQFPSRMATFLSWSAAASHLVRVKLAPCCTRSSIGSLNCTLLYSSVRSTATVRASSFLWNPSKTSNANLAEFSQVFFPPLYPPWFGVSTFLLSKSCASFLATISSISFPVVFCIVMIQYPFS